MIVRHSHFKNPEEDHTLFKDWVNQLEKSNNCKYIENSIETSLGNTVYYRLKEEDPSQKTLMIFPGFRTTSLIWDLDGGLQNILADINIILVETNGQPNLSNGDSPAIKSLDYGHWATEIIDHLELDRPFIAGASFGGIVCMKLAIVSPDKIRAVFLLNPGCFRYVSFGFRNLYNNLLPIFKTNRKNILKFLDAVVFEKPEHQLSQEGEDLLIDYLELAISNYKDRTQKPYYMGKQLNEVKTPTYLYEGTGDILIPYKKSISRAKQHLGDHLKEVKIYNAGHGIETYAPCLNHIADQIRIME